MNTTPASDKSEHRDAQRRGPFVPLLLLAISFVGWAGIQTVQLLAERRVIKEVALQQTTLLAAAHKIRMAADSLAAKVQVLADKGNPSAQVVVAKLKERGVTIDPKISTPPPP